jgi:caspase domain-containing protein
MAKRALIIGAQIHGLAGCHNDLDVIEDVLRARKFEVRSLKEVAASRDGILAGYRELIEDSAADDSAVVYYSGHGGRYENPDPGKRQPDWLQFILSTDIDQTSGDDFRGLLAEELSLFQYQLTQKTKNVTVILDCCHSARMSRDPKVVPKAWNFSWPKSAVARRFAAAAADIAAARAEGADDRWFDANPDAVRIVACGPSESAYELEDSDLGGTHGAMTDALVTLMRNLGQDSVTWDTVAQQLRRRVLRSGLVQRPEAEGPTERLLFSTKTLDYTGVLPIVVEGANPYIDHAEFFGVTEGDELLVMSAGVPVDEAKALARATVVAVEAGRASLQLLYADGIHVLPATAEAHPWRISLGRRLVTLEPANAPNRDVVAKALQGSRHLHVADKGDRPIARVQLMTNDYRLIGPDREPMHATQPIDQAKLGDLSRNLEVMARAAHLCELQSGGGDERLETPVAVDWWTCTKGTPRPREKSGETLHPGERVFVKVANAAMPGFRTETVWANVFDIGMSRKITLLNGSEPSGLELTPGKSYTIGSEPGLNATGLPLSWPAHLPATGSRAEAIVVIFSDAPQDLRRLQTDGVRGGGGQVAGRATAPSSLKTLLDSVNSGTREFDRTSGLKAVRYRVERIDFLVDPGGLFLIEHLPEVSQRLSRPRSGASLPDNVAVRMLELQVKKNGALRSTDLRLDALFVTHPRNGADPVTAMLARTERFQSIGDGDCLPVDKLILFNGPVREFLDIAIWISEDTGSGPALFELFADIAGNEGVQEVIGSLASLAGLAGAAAAGATIGAVGTLIRTAGKVLASAVGPSIGLYRTTLLPIEGFGLGRRPAQKLLDAEDIAFAYEAVPLN